MDEVEHCSWKWEFQCPKLWSGMRQTDDPNVRMCDVCLEKVYLCETDEEIVRHARSGHCVAVGQHEIVAGIPGPEEWVPLPGRISPKDFD